MPTARLPDPLRRQLTGLSADPPGLHKPIVFIGGAPGTGKSTLANLLLYRLDLDHRIGTGFIRAILQSEASKDDEPQLFSSTFESDDPTTRVMWQAHRMPSRGCCVRGSSPTRRHIPRRRGKPPDPERLLRHGHRRLRQLAAPSETEHTSRIGGHRHTQRTLAPEDIRRIRLIDDLYRRDATRSGVPVLSGDAPLSDLVQALVDMIPPLFGHPPGRGDPMRA